MDAVRVLGIYAPDPGNALIPHHLMTALAGNMSSRHNHYLVDLTDGATLTAALTERQCVPAADGAVGPNDTTAFIRHWEKFLSMGVSWLASVEGAAALAQARPLQKSAARCFLMRGSTSELRDIFCGYAAMSSTVAENRRLPHGMRAFFDKLATVPNRQPTVYVLALPSDLSKPAGHYAARACTHLITYRSLPVPVPPPAQWPDVRPTGSEMALVADGAPRLSFALVGDMAPAHVVPLLIHTLSAEAELPLFRSHHHEPHGFYFLWASARNSDLLRSAQPIAAMTRCAASVRVGPDPTRAIYEQAMALVRTVPVDIDAAPPPPSPRAAASKPKERNGDEMPPPKEREMPPPNEPSRKRPLRSPLRRLSKQPGRVDASDEETGDDDEEDEDEYENIATKTRLTLTINGKDYPFVASTLSAESTSKETWQEVLQDWLAIEGDYESRSYGELVHRLLHIIYLKDAALPEAFKSDVAAFIDPRKGKSYNSKKGDLVAIVKKALGT